MYELTVMVNQGFLYAQRNQSMDEEENRRQVMPNIRQKIYRLKLMA